MSLDPARIFHVNVNCSNLERSRAFYVDSLGLSLGVRTTVDHPQPGAGFGLERAQWDAWILLGPNGYDGGAIDLLEWIEPVPAGRVPERGNIAGFQRLGVRVPDLDAVLDRVGERSRDDVRVHARPDGREVRIVHVGDPDGTPIELVEGGGPALAFVAVACADLDRSIACYRALGFRELARFSSENDDGGSLRVEGPVAVDEVMLSPPGGGEVTVILVGFRTPPVESRERRPANALGIWRLALLVPEVAAARASLVASGMEPISEPVEMEMGESLPNLRFVCARGPDGEVIELIEAPG